MLEGSSVGRCPSPGVQDLNAGRCVLQEALGTLSLMHHNKFEMLKASFFRGVSEMERSEICP